LRIEASFVISAARAEDLPRDGLAEIALVGRSNVGKSSLINALVRQKVARTSSAPGKTRLANVYRIARGGSDPFYLVDLPGYGYARGLRQAQARPGEPVFDEIVRAVFARTPAALLLIDARHPGLESDIAAWRWLNETGTTAEIVAAKIDKLSRAERHRALNTNDAAFEHPVLPVSAVTGEGLDELWTLINRLLSQRSSPRPLPLPRPSTRLGAALSEPKGRSPQDPPRPRLPRRKN
jgi:GTP-binding protein